MRISLLYVSYSPALERVDFGFLLNNIVICGHSDNGKQHLTRSLRQTFHFSAASLPIDVDREQRLIGRLCTRTLGR